MSTEDNPHRTEHRFLLKCETVSPLTHGSGATSPVTDSPFRRTAAGNLVIAGTSIAGALRSVVERLRGRSCVQCQDDWIQQRGASEVCRCDVCSLFGNVVSGDDPNPQAESAAAASRIWVADAVIEAASTTRIVDSVRIDRQRKAAIDTGKFDREELAPGAMLWLDIRAENLSDDELSWLTTGLQLFANGTMGLGGGAAAGSGTLTSDVIAIYQRDFGTQDGLLAAIIHNSHQLPNQPGDPLPAWSGEVTQIQVGPVDLPGLQFRWEFNLAPNRRWGGTFLVADPVASNVSGWDRAPRGLGLNQFQAELPSRSVRGALRGGAERILRTLAQDAQDPAVVDHLIDQLFGSEERASRLQVRVEVDQKRLPDPVPFDHVAIDRFTGGAADSKKFDALAARGGSFRLTLTMVDAPPDKLPWMKGLLALTLRDLHEGRITIGSGSAKGHGMFELSDSWTAALDASDESINEWVNALCKTLAGTMAGPSRAVDPTDTKSAGEAADIETRDAGSPQPQALNVSPSAPRRQPAMPHSATPGTNPQLDATTHVAVRPRTSWLSTCNLHLASLDVMGLNNPPRFLFLESPTLCLLRDVADFEKQLPDLLWNAWHFRLFGPGCELAARRLSFDGPHEWSVRLICDGPVPEPVATSAPSQVTAPLPPRTELMEKTVRLLGSTREPGSNFQEDQYAGASGQKSLTYPGHWETDMQLSLVTQILTIDGRDLVVWSDIRPV